jgi:phosphoglycerate dehydrogenase-like enzyme
MKNKILYLGPETHLSLVENLLPDFLVIHANSDYKVDENISDCEVIFDAYMKIKFDKQRLVHAKKLKLFITATTGFSHIDKLFLDENNIPLYTLADQKHITANLTAAAEHTWLLLMSVARKLTQAHNHVVDGGWDRNLFPGVMLRGKTLGIIGCGRIGTWMSKYAQGFDIKVLGYDEYNTNSDSSSNIKYCELNEVLEKSDFISINIPLNPKTYNFLNKERLKLIKRTSIIVNSSRGEVIDENYLLYMLENNLIFGAGLDVLIGEPIIENHPLVAYAKTNNNLILTPHIGGFSPESLDIVFKFSSERIIDFFNE